MPVRELPSISFSVVVKNVRASGRNVELNRVPERRSVTEVSERDGTMTDMASTYVLCPRFEEPCVR